MTPLARRPARLEPPTIPRLIFRAYADRAEADADNEPSPPGTTVIAIITGVARWSGWDARRHDGDT